MYSNLVHNNNLAMSTFSSQAGVPQAEVPELDGKTHLCGFRYLRQHTAEINVSTCKRVYSQRFLQSLASVLPAALMFLLLLALCCRSTCQFGRNSEKSNHMLSATSNIELEFFITFLQSQHHCIWVLQVIFTHCNPTNCFHAGSRNFLCFVKN